MSDALNFEAPKPSGLGALAPKTIFPCF